MTMDRAFLGISHSPLIGLNAVDPTTQQRLDQGLDAARGLVRAFAPDLVVLIAPDHYNGFFNELMPAFCIGTQARAVGDYLTPAGDLNVAADAAVDLARHLMEEDFDIAVSRSMRVDHGFAQPLQFLWGGLDTPPLVPIFLNAVAQPSVPRVRRCRAFGESLGRFVDRRAQRVLLIGSGGLSHEPPVPTLDHADPSVRERITIRNEPSAEDRAAKVARVMAAGVALASGTSAIKPLNPDWDRRWMDAIADGGARLDALSAMSESGISQQGGMSAHESKTWLVARSALPTDRALACRLRHYQCIPEFIAGFGVMWLQHSP